MGLRLVNREGNSDLLFLVYETLIQRRKRFLSVMNRTSERRRVRGQCYIC